jgi:plastocyanin
MRARSKLLTALVVGLAALGLLAAAGCGGTGNDTAGTTGTTAGTTGTTAGGQAQGTVIDITASEQGLAFQQQRVTAPAGTITLRMTNPSPLEHNIAMDRPRRVLGQVVGQGGVSEITVDLPPGEYEYYCSVPGHREGGMVGTLVVE